MQRPPYNFQSKLSSITRDMHLSINNKIKSLINNFSENMIHFIFLLNTSHLKKQHKICFTIFGSQKQEIWFFARKPKIRILNKRKGGKERVADSGSHPSGSSSSRPRRSSPAISPRRRGLRPNPGHQRDPRTLTTRLTPLLPRRSHRKGLTVGNGGSAEVPGVTPEPSGR